MWPTCWARLPSYEKHQVDGELTVVVTIAWNHHCNLKERKKYRKIVKIRCHDEDIDFCGRGNSEKNWHRKSSSSHNWCSYEANNVNIKHATSAKTWWERDDRNRMSIWKWKSREHVEWRMDEDENGKYQLIIVFIVQLKLHQKAQQSTGRRRRRVKVDDRRNFRQLRVKINICLRYFHKLLVLV